MSKSSPDSLTICAVTTKSEYVPLFDIHTGNNAEIDELLEEPEVIEWDEEVTMMVGKSGVPQPMSVTADELIKRENDQLSGNIPFNLTVGLILIIIT